MKLWSDLYDLVTPDLPGCAFAAVNSALRQSAIVFCAQSLAWQEEHPPVAVQAETAEYAFIPPTGAAVHAITYARFNGKEISPHTGELNFTTRDWRNQTGTPEYVLGGPTSLRLVPEPDAGGTLTITVALKPSASSAGIDEHLFNEYREAIVHGALARLMLSPKKPYTNTQLAQYHQQQFLIQTAMAGTRAARNFTRGPLRTAILRRG
ncbi:MULTISPECIES: hypothetical protein [unclassified Nitrosospira]|uniref:phage adaptor protein n=1 Tax=unclassified Nitrosospira TaxID=2609267 RepID=UPI000D3023C3|nr:MULTISPECIES: hypothetical protein [unclassified Nitrosospira]PTR16254.1 hypothetical protein C8R31_102268 [Nitrosospira sp. Nsp2]WON73745.1 hypothetical protein R5L00_14880 [Nitrosospira sp. Is2]